MVRFIRIFLLLLVASDISLGAYAKNGLTDEEKLGKGWIVSYVSYDKFDNSIIIVDVKALIESTPRKVWGLLTNINRWSSWTPVMSKGWVVNSTLVDSTDMDKSDENYKKFSSSSPAPVVVSDEGVTNLKTFEEFDFPWPINNDWVVRGYTFDATGAKDENYSVSWKQMFHGTEGRGGRWNISRHNGPDSDTLFEYHFRVKRRDGIPKKIFEIIIGKTVDRFINAIRKNV